MHQRWRRFAPAVHQDASTNELADTAAGRVPLMAQTSHHVFSHCVELGNHAEEIGIDLAIVMNPYFPPRPSDDIVRAWYRELDRETSIPTFLFNTS